MILVTTEIFNPFTNSNTDLKYTVIRNYNEQDKAVYNYVLQTRDNKDRKDQLIEFIYRIYSRKQTPMPKKDIEAKLDFTYHFIENCFNDRYSFEIFNNCDEKSIENFSSFLAETIVAARRVLVGLKNTKQIQGGGDIEV